MIRNLMTDLPAPAASETFETLLRTETFKLERIVSTGQATPPGEWFDQDRDEWVLLVSGEAALRFEGASDVTILRPGDHVHIAAHRKHRVEWTAARGETIWLALHFDC